MSATTAAGGRRRMGPREGDWPRAMSAHAPVKLLAPSNFLARQAFWTHKLFGPTSSGLAMFFSVGLCRCRPIGLARSHTHGPEPELGAANHARAAGKRGQQLGTEVHVQTGLV